MKNLTMNHPTNIFRTILSGLKETAIGFFSMSEGNKYITENTEVKLTGELYTNTETVLNPMEEAFQANGVTGLEQLFLTLSNSKNSKNKSYNLKNLNKQPIKIIKRSTHTNVRNKNDNELEIR